MNANELADAMQGVISVLNVHHEEDCLFIANECQFMLRQLQAENEKLKEQLQIVSKNLHMGISKSIQKFQAKCIDEVLRGEYE